MGEPAPLQDPPVMSEGQRPAAPPPEGEMSFLDKMMACFGPPKEEVHYRKITVLRENAILSPEQLACSDNAITTAKYNIITYIPRSLFEQFRRLANVYFLVISLLMVLGTYTTLFTSPLAPYSTLGPLCLVLALTMIKEGVEDVKRHRSDRFVNTKRAYVLKTTAEGDLYTEIKWRDIRVGNIVRLDDRKEVPADVILLTSSEPGGVAYIETAEIDGETNLKVRACAHTRPGLPPSPLWKTPEELVGLRMDVVYDKPNDRIHFFNGTLELEEADGSVRQVSVDQSNLLLRGASLRNTHWALGVVVYTGKETKVVKNQRKAPSKQSNVDIVTNRIMAVIFLTMALVTTISLIAYIIFKAEYESDLYYLCYDYENSPNSLFRDNCDSSGSGSDAGYWFTFLILYNNFVPISLYVTLEIVSYILGMYVDCDKTMYDEAQNTPALARTSSLMADLGQIEYVFSDKTGTLTQNVMKFKRCSVEGNMYGEVTESDKAKMPPAQREKVTDAPPLELLRDLTKDAEPSSALYHFAMCLSTTHTVVLETDEKTGATSLQAESPDEEALVDGGEKLGVKFVGRSPGEITVLFRGKQITYQTLVTLPFDSTRKRMSVMVRSPEGKYILYCKGADNIILDRTKSFIGTDKDTVNAHLSVFANDGLRTLVLAKREFSESEYNKWAKQYHTASTSQTDRAELIAEAAKQVEVDLQVIGVTAIEDKLQDDVPATIADLGHAGVKVWVLTGDKMETAINIGYSCRLLEEGMTLIKIRGITDRKPGPGGDAEARAHVRQQLVGLLAHFSRLTEEESVFGGLWSKLTNRGSPKQGQVTDPSPLSHQLLERPSGAPPLSELSSESLAMIIDGPTLNDVMGVDELEMMLLKVARLCRSVVACRVSPKQKASIVRLVRYNVHPTPITLAIGDGANDVSMIQEAHVGVGISGKEGRQAVNNSDYAIAQFKFLKTLMLVHGHWDYRRLCKVILYSFYKNMVLSFILFYYIFFSAVSGQSLYESIVYSGYNFFLAMPPLCVGIFDKDVEKSTVLRCHKLYGVGIMNRDLNLTLVVRWVIQGVIDSFIIFFLPLAAYDTPKTVWAERGYADGIYVFGTTVYSCLVVAMLLKICSFTRTYTVWTFAFIAFSVSLYVGFLFAYAAMADYAYDFYGVTTQMMSRVTFWLLLIQVPAISFLCDQMTMWVKSEFFDDVSDHAVEFDRNYTSGTGQDLFEQIKMSQEERDARARAMEPARPDAPAERDAASGRYVIPRSSLARLNASVPQASLRDLGIETGGSQSSFAYDFIANNIGEGASESAAERRSITEEEETLRRRSSSASLHDAGGGLEESKKDKEF